MIKYLFLLVISICVIACREEIKGPFNKWELKKLAANTDFKGEKPVNTLNVDFIDEASGIDASALNPGYYFVNNDSGSPSEIYMIDSIGHYCGKIILEDIENRDWEEIKIGPGPDSSKNYIYVADIGDNKTKRPNYFIYRIEEPQFNIDHSHPFEMKTKADKISFQYPEGKSYNCEAFIINHNTKDLYLFTKGKRSTLFKLAYPQSLESVNTAHAIVTLPIEKVTAADLSANGTSILVKDYRHIYYWETGSKTIEETLSTTKPSLLNYQIEPQGEAICWSINGNSFFTLSELEHKTVQYLIRYNKK